MYIALLTVGLYTNDGQARQPPSQTLLTHAEALQGTLTASQLIKRHAAACPLTKSCCNPTQHAAAAENQQHCLNTFEYECWNVFVSLLYSAPSSSFTSK